MMELRFRRVFLEKRYPLRISRGVSGSATNLFVLASEDGVTGVGEMCPGVLTGCASAEEGERALTEFAHRLPAGITPHDAWRAGREAGVAPCALAALDMALWDLLAKRLGAPLHRVLGLPRRAVATSVTIGINPPEVTRERVPEILRQTGGRFLKIKLGSPDGVGADQAHFLAAREAAAGVGGIGLRVDANGGWSPEDARVMMRWLADRGVDYVEQPLHMDALDYLPALFRDRPLPIYLDESCRFASDIPAWAAHVDGINLKLMKCGGITEALRIVAVARAFGLGTMIGCMGESQVSIAAGASLSALFDHIDLDSHLNLVNDPSSGTEFVDGAVLPLDRPGHGGELTEMTAAAGPAAGDSC